LRNPRTRRTPGFGSPLLSAAAPLLQLLARLRNTLTPPAPGDLRERAVRELRRFEEAVRSAGLPRDVLRPAHYALCASLDDVVLNTPWGGRGSWSANSLVSAFHHEVQGGERFFDILALLRQSPAKFLPVLELMYFCLSLGFMGRYRLSPRGPAEIDHLREEVYGLIAAARAQAEAELSPVWRGVDAPYRPTRTRLPLWVAGSAGLALLGGVFTWFSVTLNIASDAIYARALAAPPTSMPMLARAAPVVPPAPGPIDSTALERLRSFLKPEIEAHQVEVLGSAAAPVVRVKQAGLFASGSASVLAGAVPILERIGAALKDEPGPVRVVGYTDDQPIHTVRFPSNYNLSAARAEAAQAILARTIGAPARISAEGRADADPIAPNTTAEGRDANRRIEIMLQFQG
jgi:type VI secretion system protein ImpK